MSDDNDLLRRESEQQLHLHADALLWRSSLPFPHALLWLPSEIRERSGRESLLLRMALEDLFPDRELPARSNSENLVLKRNPLGQPFAFWSEKWAEWASAISLRPEAIHLSNTHDGDATLFIAAHSERLVGVGIDLVDLRRLEHKSPPYLQRFARRFMSDEEFSRFTLASEGETQEAVLRRTASHFSLMEAASKALGTGLKIGMGMGTDFSLPMQSISVRQLAPSVKLGFTGEALRRIKVLGGDRVTAVFASDPRYLVSVVGISR